MWTAPLTHLNKLAMNSESEEGKDREDLLKAAVLLKIARDELLTCSVLLRDLQFNLESRHRQVVAEYVESLIKKVREKE